MKNTDRREISTSRNPPSHTPPDAKHTELVLIKLDTENKNQYPSVPDQDLIEDSDLNLIFKNADQFSQISNIKLQGRTLFENDSRAKIS